MFQLLIQRTCGLFSVATYFSKFILLLLLQYLLDSDAVGQSDLGILYS